MKLKMLPLCAAMALLPFSAALRAQTATSGDLAQVPLREATSGVKVLPNIMLLLDDSGSMESWESSLNETRWHGIIDMSKNVFNMLCDEQSPSNPNCIPARAGVHTINGGEFDIQRSTTKTTYLYSFFPLRKFDAAGKAAFMSHMDYLRNDIHFSSSGNLSNYMLTPLAGPISEVGRYYQDAGGLATHGPRGCTASTPGCQIAGDPVQYSCQKNYLIMFTDGQRNVQGWYAPSGALNGTIAYGNGPSAVVTDPVKAYYDTDLRPNMPNDVAGTADDPATYQHMTSFFVSVGLSSSSPYAQELQAAAAAGHGKYYQLSNASQFADALKKALSTIAAGQGSGAAAVTDDPAQTAAAGALAYEVSYDTSNWTGDVTAHRVSAIGTTSDTSQWSAAAQLATKISSGSGSGWASRTIYADVLQGNSRKLVRINFNNPVQAFGGQSAADTLFKTPAVAGLSQYANLSSAQKTQVTSASLIDWLAGDASKEGTLYRARPAGKPLGDIVHATPIYVDYDGTSSNSGDLVIAAANDGMLHAFDAATGKEDWAWMPSAAAGQLWQLADNNYASNHRFFLDGPLSVQQITVDGGAKKWILMGGYGAGEKGYWALDITNKDSPAFLWALSPDSSASAEGLVKADDVGYGMGKPYLAKVGGTWRAIIPGGYGTADNHAHVFMIDALTGENLHDFDTGAGDATTPDGIGAVTFYLADPSSGSASWAFAGDLLGDAWRFSLEGCSSQTCSATKIFDGTPDQPITAEMQVSSWNNHVLLFFGTGRYLSTSDLTTNATQSIYAIQAGISTANVAESTPALPITKNQLSAFANSGASGGSCSAFPSPGWHMDLSHAKERVYLRAELGWGLLFVSSVAPDASACESGGKSWLYLLDFRGCNDLGSLSTNKKDVVGMSYLGIDANGQAEFLVQYGDGTSEVIKKKPPLDKASAIGGGQRLMFRVLRTE